MTTEQARLRKFAYTLLITVAVGAIAGRIVATERVYDHVGRWPSERPKVMPTFSSNDRARWATIRALVDGDTDSPTGRSTYVVGRRDRQVVFASAVTPLAGNHAVSAAALALAGYQARISNDSGIIFEDGYQSVDKVLNPQTFEFYSTKPPLFPTLLAGLYWLLQSLTGWTLAQNPAAVVRTILLLVNLLPFAIYLVLISRLIERYGTSDWGRLFVMAAACFATYLTTFAITVNNHSPAACSVLFALYPAIVILERRIRAPATSPPAYLFAISGLFAAFAVCNEMPALAFLATLFFVLLLWAPRQTLLWFVPMAAIPILAYFLTNYIALGQVKPIQSEFGSIWYEYEGSHWRKPGPGQVKTGIDWARYRETRWEYAFHVLFGHHGLFSLTPIWLLALAGMFRWSFADVRFWLFKRRAGEDEADLRQRIQSLIAGITLILTVAVVGFYLVKTDNYGGFTSGLRWLMWLTPLWLLTMLPIVDRLGDHRWGRGLGYVLLAFSVLSVSYPVWNPWRHPWIYNLMTALGWPGY